MEQTKKIGYVEGGVLLPAKVISTVLDYDGEASLRRAGVIFHEPLADNKWLRLAELPQGWKIVEVFGPSKGVKSNLLDDKGRVRATMRQFYGWLPWAQMTITCPFIISFRGMSEGKLVARIRMRHGGEIKSLRPIKLEVKTKRKKKIGEIKGDLRVKLRQWLHKTMPDWRENPSYWDRQKRN